MMIRSIASAKNLRGLRVLVRVDFNVPFKNGRVSDDTRLRASVPTVKYLVRQDARVILLSHLGRPDGKRVPKFSLRLVADRFTALLGRRVKHIPAYEGPAAKRAVMGMKNGEVVLLENIRFSPQESGNKGELAKSLASLGDIFVLDGFAVAHRADASVVGIPKYLPAYAGLLLKKEIDGLTKLTTRPGKPFVVILGGAKMETKVPVLKALLTKATAVLIGGGIVSTYLKAKGYGVGSSLIDEGAMKQARGLGKHRKIIWPVDVVVGKTYGAGARRVLLLKKPHTICKKGEAILDIGPATLRLFASYIKRAKTIVWNGAMGYFEVTPYDVGTKAVARLVAGQSKGKAFGVVGGGETVQAVEMVGVRDDVDLVSTGGGAMLEFLGGKKLPGIEALRRKN